MTREARMMSGIILITVPTIQYGGYFADLADEKGQRIYGEPTASEFFPRRARPRRCDRDPVAGLPDARGRTRSADVPALVRPSWSAAVRDSHFGGVLLLDAAADRHSSQPSGIPDLRGSGDPCLWSGHAWHRVVAVSSTGLGLLVQ